MEKIKCEICPWACSLQEGENGFCGVRGNREGRIQNINYGKLAVASLDPIEKKPLKRFHPGSKILSIGANGCNLRCRHCQNFSFVMAADYEIDMMETDPQEVVETALSYRDQGNIGLAFTYNEPVTMYDFMMDTAKLSKEKGLLNVMVTNGYINEEPLRRLLPYMDAMNIDLKCFTNEGYEKLGGRLDVVKRSIEIAQAACHVEIACLIIPGENDSPEEMEEAMKWLSSVNPEIPVHIDRFFPMYKVLDKPPTPMKTLEMLREVAERYMKYVFLGNV